MKSGSGARSQRDVIQDVSKIVADITGVQLGDRQRVMVESRLSKRLRDMGINSFEEYAEYLTENRESETQALISILTTHHTYFFREFAHFEALERELLKEAVEGARAEGRRNLRVWCAACSRGQEVYSLAMFMRLHLPKVAPDFTFEIVGTDVDHESVAFAQNGVYQYREIQEIPLPFIQGHWARGNGDIKDYVKAKPSIKEICRFETLNLLNISAWKENEDFDIVFCRNVFIYFEAKQIEQITRNLLKRMKPRGSLFIGISETLNGLSLPVSVRGPSVYQHPRAAPSKPALAVVPNAPKASVPTPAQASPAPAPAPAILKVLCVDDSPSILSLLKRILSKERGFEVVATAVNGLDAAQKMKEHKVDLVTLDIHMPEQTGLEYLKKNFSSQHPPVVMISSVSREDSSLALKCLESGASDYIEKPALNTMSDRAEEIRNKLFCAVHYAKEKAPEKLSLTKSFANVKTLPSPEKYCRVVVSGLSDRKRLETLLAETKQASAVPTLVLLEGCEGMLPALAKEFESRVGRKVEVLGQAEEFKNQTLAIADFAKFVGEGAKISAGRPTSIFVFGEMPDAVATKLGTWPKAQILAEDVPFRRKSTKIIDVADDVTPATSYLYMADEFLRKKHD